ncbi:hypothetical protein HMPREF1624_05371 [Sporothrix schenckii ATCC 58251]|uniref:Peptidase C45 hydrolase domain-containing protein n=1 Tax=Sporothrix schenckii (strain ATCC 58251 / de Perez 2211183) TaxID=1391915 RepID=U7PVU6_SPOS1|nr:hypothetical protein HMPREF1624_05371 [Sporothrix schenckii ATCC 58251]
MSQPRLVKTVRCTGTPYQIGLAHGRAVAAQVHKNVATYTAFFDETVGLTWAEARARAVDQFAGRLGRCYPAILEEMQGIADGAGGGLTRDDVLTLNVRSEIALTNYTDGCTSLAQEVVGADGRQVFLAQNWDWLEELHEGMVSFDIAPETAPGNGVERFVFLGEAGIVGKIGMNSAGFGFCMNAIRSGAQGTTDRHLPVHVLARRLLQYATSLDAALAILETEFGAASCINLMLADRSGQHADVECSPYGHARIDPDPTKLADHGNASSRFVAHTNHLYGTAAQGRPARLVDHPADNSFARLARMQALTRADAAAGVPVSFASLHARLSDLEGAPYAICRSRPPGAVGMERMVTLCTILMELTTGQGRVSIGRPCEPDIPVIEWRL